jgi:hypothetical protein
MLTASDMLAPGKHFRPENGSLATHFGLQSRYFQRKMAANTSVKCPKFPSSAWLSRLAPLKRPSGCLTN